MNSQLAYLTATVFIAGFAIQQCLQLLDGFVAMFIQWVKSKRVKNSAEASDEGDSTPLPGGLSEADFKKWIMSSLSFALGLAVVSLSDIRLLRLIPVGVIFPDDPDVVKGAGFKLTDLLVSALVLGAGTEGMNTLLKYLGYIKDARSAAVAGDISIQPDKASVKAGSKFQFAARTNNFDDPAVSWDVPASEAGEVDSSGLYTAPAAAGIYQIVAKSKSNTTRIASALVTVT